MASSPVSTPAASDMNGIADEELKVNGVTEDDVLLNGNDDNFTYVPLKVRRKQLEQRIRGITEHDASTEEKTSTDQRDFHDQFTEATAASLPPSLPGKSLVDIALKLRSENKLTDDETRRREEEARLVENLRQEKQPLMGLKQAATGKRLIGRVESTWQPSKRVKLQSEMDTELIRQKYAVLVDGDHIPSPCTTFTSMRFPAPIIQHLKSKNIHKPSPIQVQGLPVVLSGRDMIGVAFTGSGKTLVFALPLIIFALQYELRKQAPIGRREGPVGIILCPSRELARQTVEVIEGFTKALYDSGVWPQIRTLLSIGGVSFGEQQKVVDEGVHIIVATPGRLLDMLNKKRITLSICQYLALDEADRLIDLGFEEDIRQLLDYFTIVRQTVLFSATMPPKIQDFAVSALNEPIIVNVGRAGAANLDVIQEVEYVREESKLLYLLECLQKTAPPVLIFASNQSQVDEIHEYLLRRGVDVVGVHGGKQQSDRSAAIDAFKSGKADVLVATDVAGKGLDFAGIQHVINYDMPKEIEDYVHRIGRTGRTGTTGVATTFINRDVCSDSILLDLKHLLREAKQRVPPLLNAIADANDDWEERQLAAAVANQNIMQNNKSSGCAYCGGLGHRVMNCPKLAHLNKSKLADSYGYDRVESSLG